MADTTQRRSGRRSDELDPFEVAKLEFNIMAGQKTEESFLTSKEQFLSKYGSLSERISGWFGFDQVAAWAECYTRKFPRLNATTTSRAESSHSALKAHLSGASRLGHLVRTLNTVFISTHNASASDVDQLFRHCAESIRSTIARTNTSISEFSMDLDNITPRGKKRSTRKIISHHEKPPARRNRSRR